MPDSRQTASFLKQRFAEVGIQPNTRRGQNFLVDLNLVEFLARAADVGPQDVVLEVGTGTGSLTAMLARSAAAVVTIEVDPPLYQLASEHLLEFDNVTILQQDALKNKNHFHPAVLETLRARLAEQAGRRLKLAANLPYNVATPVVSNLLNHDDLLPGSMTVTIQKELADRITAKPGTKDYGALSIWMQSQCEAAVLRVLPPSVFWPRPKVESAIVQIIPDPAKRARIPDLVAFHEFVRSLFFHRRKFLRSELLSACKRQLDKPAVDDILERQGLAPTTRAEALDVTQMLGLYEAVRQAGDGHGAGREGVDRVRNGHGLANDE
jgi:16S rRNA (adenine1518-N6/adenine1519-N6)-dimethyltransferase